MMQSVDVGFVFALRQEATGIIDRLLYPRTTRGNGWTFYSGDIELGQAGRRSAAIVFSDVGQGNAGTATNKLIDVFNPKLICSAGYAGGLSTLLKKSDVCIPEQIIRQHDLQTLDISQSIPKNTAPIPNKLTLITVQDVIETPEQKRELHSRTAAELADMETFAVAEICCNRDTRFMSIRIVFDAADERIPKDITKILNSVDKGVLRLAGNIFGSIITRPAIIIDLISLQRRAVAASERLAHFIVKELCRKEF